MTRPPLPRRLQGAALIMALLIMALATTLATTLVWHEDAWLQQVATRRELAQTRQLAITGIDWARMVLAEDGRVNRYDYLGEPWATKLPPMPAEGGEIGGHITDEQSRFNLNNLAKNGQPSPEDILAYQHLLRKLDLPVDLADALAGWIGNTDAAATEDAAYQSLDPPYRSAGRPLTDVDNLLHVRGYTPRIVDRLRPYVTTLPGYNPVNINTASALVISAVLNDFPLPEIQQIIVDRDRIPYIDRGDIKKRLARQDLADSPNLLRIDTSSHHFTAHVDVRLGHAETTLLALLQRPDNQWPIILWQKFE